MHGLFVDLPWNDPSFEKISIGMISYFFWIKPTSSSSSEIWINSRNTFPAEKHDNMFSKYIQTNCWHFPGGKCRLQNHVGSKFDDEFSDEKFSSIPDFLRNVQKHFYFKVFVFHKEVMIPPLRCQLRMLSVRILNRNWQNVGLVLSSSKSLLHRQGWDFSKNKFSQEKEDRYQPVCSLAKLFVMQQR